MRRPEWAANFGVTMAYGDFTFGWNGVYYDRMAFAYEDGGEIETIRQNFGDGGIANSRMIHDINGSWQATNEILVYGGVSNLTDREPYVTERGYPVSPRGAYYFLGVSYSAESLSLPSF